MPTYSEQRMRKILDAFDAVDAALEQLEIAIVAAVPNEYEKAGQEFISNMAWCHKRMQETHIIYRADAAEAEASMSSRIEPCAVVGLEVCGASQ